MFPKDADGITNNVYADQTAPGSSYIYVCAYHLSAQSVLSEMPKLSVIRVCCIYAIIFLQVEAGGAAFQ